MNRKEFQDWLNQFDEDTIIEIVYHTDGHGYYEQGGNATTQLFDVEGFCEDPRIYDNGQWWYTDHNGEKILLIGGIRQ